MTPNVTDVKSGHCGPDEKDHQNGETHETLHRVYNTWTASAYQVLMMASWSCNVVLYSTVFDVGGPMMLIYSTIIVTIGQCLMMSSLAEMCSVWPYAGGQQAFTKYLAPQSIRRFLSYVVGWVVIFGEVATAVGCAMNSAQVTVAVVELHYPSFVSETWVTYLIYFAMVLLSLLFSLSQKYLPAIGVLGLFVTLGGGLAWAASFLALAPKHTASFVFTKFINNSGYQSSGWVGIMSFYTPIYALYGTDGILHIAEEMQDAPRSAPRAIVYSMIFTGITSLAGALVMGFCSGNWEAYIDSDFPFLTWWVDILDSSSGGSAFVILTMVSLNFLITVGLNTAGSRLVWSMANDFALPFSRVFQKINKSLQTPLACLLLIAGIELLIGLVLFGSDLIFQIVISVSGVCIQIGYLIPVLMLLVRGRGVLRDDRQFNLGRFGLAINVSAVCWSSLIIIMLFSPLYVPITAASLTDMNWAIALFAGYVMVISIDWIFRGRRQYFVPEE